MPSEPLVIGAALTISTRMISAKRQGRHAQVVIAKAQDGHGNEKKKAKMKAIMPPSSTEIQKGVNRSETGQIIGSRIHMISLLGRRQYAERRNVCPYGDKAGMPKGKEAGETVDQVQRKRENDIDENKLWRCKIW